MAIQTYFVSKVGNNYVSKNFKVKEFQSHDGADKVLIDTALVDVLQRIRTHFGRPVTISSAYRTASYNASVGGSSSSYHTKGQAADIQIANVSPVIVGMYAQTIGAGGIGVYSYPNGGFVHIDTRAVKYRWLTIVRGGSYQQISKVMPTIAQGRNNVFNAVVLLQRKLNVSQSGTFGEVTTNAVKTFQKRYGLSVDGIVGEKTWRAMFL